MRAFIAPEDFVTATPWPRPTHGGPAYGPETTYRLAAAWLEDCRTVADWGGGFGYFQQFLPATVRYTLVDGTRQRADQVLADLATYAAPSEGILLRHVLDQTPNWRSVLGNALLACRRRLVVVTFTPAARVTTIVKLKSGWPIWHFNPEDLRRVMGDLLVHEDDARTSHPEHVYYCERR